MMNTTRALLTSVVLLWSGHATAQDLVAVNYFSGDLYRLDATTGAGTVVGPIGFDRLNSMARDGFGTIYSASENPGAKDELIRIDPATGVGTPVVVTDLDRINAMAFGPGGELYVTSQTTSGIFTLDMITGSSTPVGNLLCPNTVGLAYGNGQLYLWSPSTGLLDFDLASGTCGEVNPGAGTGGAAIQCLAIDDAGNLYGAQHVLYSIDVATGLPTFIGTGGYTDLRGIEFESAAPLYAAYCVAKTNLCGGTPSIGGTGVPSATASSGFVVDVDNVVPRQRAALLYTAGGAANLPFQGGTLCVGPVVQRTVVVRDAVGTPPLCNGTISIDMNAYAHKQLGGKPAPFLRLPGTTVHCQFWDWEMGSELLSDGLVYAVGP